MLSTGTHLSLRILRSTSVGLFLGDDQGNEVLLPNKYCPDKFSMGDEITVFIYRDYEDRQIATTLMPKILLHQFGFLRVTSVENVGAFLDWGLEKELMVPFSEQRQKMQVNRWYIVYLDLDPKTDRLYATNKLEKHLQNNELNIKVGDEVDLLVYQKSDLGYSVIINHRHKGMLYNNEIFREINIGNHVKGYVKLIREDQKIDVSLQPAGFESSNEINCETIRQRLFENEFFMPVNDESTPEEIYRKFKMSKKAFKRAIGTLFKQENLSIDPAGIRWIGKRGLSVVKKG